MTEDIRYIGVNDHQVDLFEAQYPVPHGMSYNSYLIMDEKTAVMDTVDIHFTDEWLKKLAGELGGRKPDYLIVQHMEPDHSANILHFLETYPDATVVGNAKTFAMMEQFFRLPENMTRLLVKNGDTLTLGRHVLTFVFAPMVHWPEVMVTYDSTAHVLFSADGFGRFGALDSGEEGWDDEAARYYIGIVGKYGMQVQNLLKAASGLDIRTICSLHGPVLEGDLSHYLDLYNKWSSYTPELSAVTLAYTSVYGHTKEAVMLLKKELEAAGTKVFLFDLCRDDMTEAVSYAFRTDRLVLATTTYNADIYPFMRDFIERLTERNFRNRKIAMIENGSWAPMAKKVMTCLLGKCCGLTFAEHCVTIRSALSDANRAEIAALAKELA